ncbi:alpha,alpha-trehalose-phosphate synthase (UDP-forming) [Plasticicumulans acidivorans]|uniref:Trehalose 6-phosphate synthase n=1 Tax=Plasticicumulans acidivorans TaxID=886464 RepID=A0A317N0J1_9GAMM|nr:trehalose-6-phosphate synthase [Plasticicumulans acidivorans]PWV65644.1 trehalose 6-phosphate synthase [Plasticicumulans acidivorans]
MSRLVMVSNRVTLPRNDGQAAGGLAVALEEALQQHQGLWFGWSGTVLDEGEPSLHEQRRGKVRYAVLDLPRDLFEAYYNGYANRSLWPLFHFRTDLVVYDRNFEAGYLAINRLFGERLAPLLNTDDLIWVHDYQLIPLGRYLRGLGCSQRMGFFLHIPFPSPSVLTTLPGHADLVQSLFAYDLIGVQTEADRRALREYVVHEIGGYCCDDEWLYAFGRSVRVEVFPVGIDVEDFAHLAGTITARDYERRLRSSLVGRELIVGVDRLDYSKGLPQRFAAFERLLERHPEHLGGVSFLQIAPSSREDVPEYNDIRNTLETLAGHINGRFADFDWAPIRYLNRALSRVALAGFYRCARIGLVTPLRDGMNLVAKEYIAAQDPDNPGVLVLSRFAGAAEQLDAALIVNPYDADAVAEAIHTGLQMRVHERRERWNTLMAALRDYDTRRWRESFVEILEASQESPLQEAEIGC